MLQNVIVALIVLVASAYVAWAVWPANSRLRVLQRFDAALGPREIDVPRGWLQRFIVRPLLRLAEVRSGCGACSANPATPAPTKARRES
jgi:hypothetical protein